VSSFRQNVHDDDLPPVTSALWYSIRLAYKAEPRLLLVSFALITSAWIPDAFAALWLKVMVNGVTDGDNSAVLWAAAGLAAAAAVGWVLRTIGSRVVTRFRDRATIELEAHVARLQGSVPSIEHHERSEYLDRLQLLREHVFLLNHFYDSFFNAVGSVGRIVITVVLLASVSPVLIFLVLFALPAVYAASKRATAERRTEEAAAPFQRLARHLFDITTTASSGKELRVDGTTESMVERRHHAWRTWYADIARARWTSAAWHSVTWTIFGLAYVGAVVYVSAGLDASPGDVLLVLSAGAALSRYVGTTVGQAEFLRWTLDASQRLAWLEQYATTHAVVPDAPVPERLVASIRFENVSFQYPGTERWVLQDVDLEFKAGSVVALVGENGAGKTTLVKLLCKFYEPTLGRITVDGVDLQRLPATEWRNRLSGAFQDFFKFEYDVQQSIGVGDLERADEEAAVLAAVGRAGANDVLERMPSGLATQLGPTWHEGVELSIGQWQKLALARGFMRERPLVIVLDEPTAALDAETEHSLFERFAAESRAAGADGRVTVLVSHRFSTVRMADQIVVLDGARVVEHGTHDALMKLRGTYAELYTMQASAYR
jgi:ATP-binding cassette, subfamily B, bacterial